MQHNLENYGLCRAAQFGQSDVCLDLLQRCADPEFVNALSYGRSPIYSAVFWSGWVEEVDEVDAYIDTVRHLVRYGANVSVVNDDGDTPMHAAIRETPVLEFLKILLDSPGPKNVNLKYKGQTPLMLAMSTESLSIEIHELVQDQVCVLLAHGADVHTVDNLGNSVLHQERIDNFLLEKFLEHGVDINRRGEKGLTALHALVQKAADHPSNVYYHRMRLLAKVQMFIDAGCDIGIVDNRGFTAEDTAISYFGEESAVSVLLLNARRRLEESRLAFAMGYHPRLGINAHHGDFDANLIQMILNPRYFEPTHI